MKTLEQHKELLRHTIFYASDFVDGNAAKKWWTREFKQAAKMPLEVLKGWASDMLDYLYDFSEGAYYLRDEIEMQLTEIINL